VVSLFLIPATNLRDNVLTVSREGNDGSWSTFEIQVGTPAQAVRVLPATTRYGISIVYNGVEGVYADTNGGKECARSEGVFFDPTKSLSWQPRNRFGLNEGSDGRQYGIYTSFNRQRDVLTVERV
jgi:hypothetical protein